jgi:hypothetical protein
LAIGPAEAQVKGELKARTLEQIIDFADGERAVLAPWLPQLSLVVDDLDALTDAALEKRDMPPAARLALAALQHVRGELTLDELIGRLERWIEELPLDERGANAIVSLIEYIQSLRPEANLERLRAAVAKARPGVEDRLMTTLRELKEQGRTEGRAEGEAHALARTLVRLLTLRFTTVPDDARQKIATASTTSLERWIERVVTATTIESVLAD